MGCGVVGEVSVEGVAIVSWSMANYKLVYVREGVKRFLGLQCIIQI